MLLDLLWQSVELTGRVLHKTGSPQEEKLSANCGWRRAKPGTDLTAG